MTETRCVCPRCLHPVCPNPDAQPPYDEVSHEIDGNILSVRIPKRGREFQRELGETQRKLSFEFDCADAKGEERCKQGCTKVHVIPDKQPPEKTPDEETFSLKATRQILYNDDLKNTLEIEFKAPRNYIPLADLGPPPPIIVPKSRTVQGKSKRGTKSKK